MSMISYGDPTITVWEVDDNGNKVSVPILNETKQVIGNKFVLEGIPDEQYRVFIDGFVEINIKEKITEPNQFKVDYRKYGTVFVHESLNGQWLNVNKYFSRGMIFIPSSKVWVKIDEFGNVLETLDDAVEKIELVSDVITDIDNTISEANNLKTQLESAINDGEQLNGILNNTIATGESLKQDLPLLVDSANNSKIDLENVISQSITTKNELNNTITNANNKITELNNTINSANAINDTLSNPTTGTIKQAIDINNELKNTIQSSTVAKSNLETSIQSSIDTKVNLDSSILEAINTKSALDNSISEGNILKGELEDIIAGTDLEQVITDISNLKQDQHNHSNKEDVLDKLSVDNGVLKYDGQDVGKGDMDKETYDKNNNGKVDIAENSEKLGGYEPSYYASKTELNNIEQKAKDYTDQQITLVDEKVNIIDDGKVNKAGDKMTGNLDMDGKNVTIYAPETTGGWSNYFALRNKNNGVEMLFGMRGTGDIVDFSYIGNDTINNHLRFYTDKTQVMKPLEEVFTAISIGSQQEFDNYINSVASNMPNYAYYKRNLALTAAIPIPMGVGGTWLLEGNKVNSLYQWQILTSYMNGGVIYFRTCTNGTWSEWYPIVINKPTSWINATLVNGWAGTVHYRKNNIGQLEMKIQVDGSNATANLICNIPADYRPKTNSIIPLWKNDNTVKHVRILNASGELSMFDGTSNSWAYGSCILTLG